MTKVALDVTSPWTA